MKLTTFIFFFFINLFCSNLLAQTIAIVNVQSLIDNNYQYIEKINEIEIGQKKYLDNFKTIENNLSSLLNEINESKLILSNDELNSKIDNYNSELQEFNMIVDEFNLHYQNEIFNLRDTILKEIILLLEKYASDNKIDLILDSTSYLIAANSLNITNNISEELKKVNLKLKYDDFETN